MELQAKNVSIRHPWARLLRVPNLFTVPGDVLAGYAAASAVAEPDSEARLAVALLGAVFLYAAGLAMNDLMDAETDRRERPSRPIPSGAISTGAVRALVAALLGGAMVMLGLASLPLLAAGLVTGGLVFLYNAAAKRHRIAGPLVMGLCRAGSVSIGVAAAGVAGFARPEVLAVMGWWWLYVAVLAGLAAREVGSDRGYGWERWWPVLVTLGGAVTLIPLAGDPGGQATTRSVFCFVMAMGICQQAGMALGLPGTARSPSGRIVRRDTAIIYPSAIGLLVSALIPMQAGVLILHAAEPWILLAALLVLLLWPVNRGLAKVVPAS